MRILFASVHGYVDPSSGAARTTRDLLEALAARGHDCRVVSTGVLDYHRETPLEPVLAGLGVPARHRPADAGGRPVPLWDLTLEGVRVALLPTASSRIERSPDRAESAAFLELAERALGRFRPHVLLTYGGHPANRELMRRARRRAVAVVFHLHNLAYADRHAFADAAAVLVPSEFARRHYARRLGLDCTALPPPLAAGRVVAAECAPRYLTFVNPVPAKGLAVFARIAAELSRRRPEIPLLVVEGRGTADWLAEVPLDLSGLANLHRMANTADPRHFYRVSRAVLVPSLVPETFGRVAAEALANGIPVLAGDRGALPEALAGGGFVLPVPARCTPGGGAVPTAGEVAPWLAVIERLWDDPAWEAAQRERALAAARRRDPGRVAGAYEEFFGRLADRHGAT